MGALIRDNLCGLFRARDRRPIYEWAHDNLTELPPTLTIRGAFSVDSSRHFIASFDALKDERVRQVVVRKPLRGGGTLISDVWHCWTRATDPGPAMAIFQSDKIATDHATHRLIWMMTHCECIKSLLSFDRHQLKNSEITFADGLPLYVTGPGINNLQTRGIRYMSISEAWIKDVGKMIENAEGRLGDFKRIHSSKIFFDSQAGEENDQLDLRFNEGNQAWWNVQCQRCGEFMPPVWTGHREDGTRWGMRWDEIRDERGNWNVAKAVETLRFECKFCGHPHTDSPRLKSEWNRTGKYVELNPNASPEKKSFHWSAMITDIWGQLAEKYLMAINAYKLGVITPLIEFFQKYMAEPKSEASIHTVIASVPTAKYEINSDWPSETHRFLTVDVQEIEFWYIVRAWSKTGESRRIEAGRCNNWTDIEDVQKKHKIQDTHVFIDSGYRAREVYSKCCQHGSWAQYRGMFLWYGWHPTKGDPEKSFRHVFKGKKDHVYRSYAPMKTVDAELGTEYQGIRQCQLIIYSDPMMQERMDFHLKKGLMQSPSTDTEMDRIYKKHIGSEFKKAKKNEFTGKVEMVYVCPSGENHLRDCEKQQMLAATLAEILPDADLEPAVIST